jgi:L-threo-3-deoxy-hexylosonate aldolase
LRINLNLDPGASGGIDMDSDLIEEMAADISNLCGVKLTCGNVGKLTRIAATVSVPSFVRDHPRKNKDAPLVLPLWSSYGCSRFGSFLVLGGFVDFLLPSLYANGHGSITGLANVYPYTLHALWSASLATLPSSSDPSVERLQYAQYLQGIAARADRTIAVTGIPGTKWLMERRYGYGGFCRTPLMPFEDSDGEKLLIHKHVVDIEKVEVELAKLRREGEI